MPKKKPARKKTKPARPSARKKVTSKKKAVTKRKPYTKKKSARGKPVGRRGTQQTTFPVTARGRRGLDAGSGGQAGDDQGLSQRHLADSESVQELVDEGQYLEADAVSGVENAKDPDQGEVRTREVPEDDVPSEYTDPD